MCFAMRAVFEVFLAPAARGDGLADDGVPQLRLRPGDARLLAALLLVSQVACFSSTNVPTVSS